MTSGPDTDHIKRTFRDGSGPRRGQQRDLQHQRAVVRRRAGVEVAQPRRDLETGDVENLPELEVQASGVFDVLPRLSTSGLLHLEYIPRHGNSF